MSYKNEMSLKFSALSENESFARLAVASFCSNLKLTVDEISDIKTAVSEGVTNAVVHAYNDEIKGDIVVNCNIENDEIKIEIIDFGVGIDNISEAIKPFFTSKPEMERSGMGFTVMEGFMDKMEVESTKNNGTKVTLIKKIKN